MRTNPYKLISSARSRTARPASIEEVSQFAAAAMKQHAQVVWCDVQDLANLSRAKTVDLAESGGCVGFLPEVDDALSAESAATQRFDQISFEAGLTQPWMP